MRIAFLNPWFNAAENQTFASIRIAAERAGYEVIECSNSAEVEACSPDFVLATSVSQAKLNDVPHYGNIHSPFEQYLSHRDRFHNLLSYDGYLTISDTLHTFLRNLMFGIGADVPIGFFYIAPQRQQISANLQHLIERRKLRITYFGVNYDFRRAHFFARLSEAEDVEICGPEPGWRHINQKAYGGSHPFDGISVQARYANNGIGLCMLSEEHLRDDVVSNRIFEITSVGAIALCCDTPWIRKHFGDSVYYFDQTRDDEAMLQAVLGLRNAAYQDAEGAISKAAKAREIFENRFAVDVLLSNTVDYHQEVTSRRRAAVRDAEQLYSPLISVIIRCGLLPPAFLGRALQSIARQTYGRFEIIFVRFNEIDAATIASITSARIVSVNIVDRIGDAPGAGLCHGLNAAKGQYFAILNEQDWWFSDHFEQLFRPFPERALNRFMAYSGVVAVHPSRLPITGGGYDDRALHSFGIESLDGWRSVVAAATSNSFVASRDLLDSILLKSPNVHTIDDRYLILSLLGQTKPHFSYAATSVIDRTLISESNLEDDLSLQLRMIGNDRPRFLSVDAWKPLSECWAHNSENSRRVVDEPGLDFFSIGANCEQVGRGFAPEKSNLSSGSHFVDARTGAVIVQTPVEPWSYGAVLYFERQDRESSQYRLIAEVVVRKGTVGLGVLNLEESDFLTRSPFAAGQRSQTVDFMIADLSRAGRFVIQNWDTFGDSVAELISLKLMACCVEQK